MQVYVAVLLAAVIRCAAQVVLAQRDDSRCVASARTVDVNRAGVAELQTLPGIGRGRARAIVLHRVRHGRFATLDDLARVDGLGPAVVSGLRAHARVGPGAAEPAPASESVR